MTVTVSQFHAMNTEIALLSPRRGPEFERAATIVHHLFEKVEQCLSRFRDDSELCNLNRSGGALFQASPLLFKVVWLAVQAAADTNGMFDPTVLSALERAGYDRSFEHIHAPRGSSRRSEHDLLPDYRAIQCDPRSRSICLRAGQRIDLGGIGKGFAVDHALAATAFLADRCIAAGGDVAVNGSAGTDDPWTVALEDAGDLGSRSIAVQRGAVATSTICKRHWQRDEQEYHHAIDPRTGRPSLSSLRTVTTIAISCVQAEVAAKTALLLDDDGMAFLEKRGMHGFGVRRDGSTVRTSQWPVATG